MRFLPLVVFLIITGCSSFSKKMEYAQDARSIKDCRSQENSQLPMCERIKTAYPYCFTDQRKDNGEKCQRFFDCFSNRSITRDYDLLCGSFFKSAESKPAFASSLSERISNNFVKNEIETCKETIKKTRPNFSLVECNESEGECQQRIRRMAPSVDCTYHLEPCKQAALKSMLTEWKSRIPESCHELKKKYPKAFYVAEGPMP